MKDALCRAAVIDWVVQDSIVEPVARHQLVLPAVRIHRERQLPSQPVVVENEGLRGQAHGRGGPGVREELVDVALDSPVGRAEMVGEQPGLLAVAREEIACQVEHLLLPIVRGDPHAHGREFQQDRTDGGGSVWQPDRPIRPQSYSAFQLHACLPAQIRLPRLSRGNRFVRPPDLQSPISSTRAVRSCEISAAIGAQFAICRYPIQARIAVQAAEGRRRILGLQCAARGFGAPAVRSGRVGAWNRAFEANPGPQNRAPGRQAR